RRPPTHDAHLIRCGDSAGLEQGLTAMTDVRELSIEVRGMTCDHCERSVSRALQSVPGVQNVLEVRHAGALARTTAGPGATADRLERAAAKAGYRARVKDRPQPPESPAVISRGQ